MLYCLQHSVIMCVELQFLTSSLFHVTVNETVKRQDKLECIIVLINTSHNVP